MKSDNEDTVGTAERSQKTQRSAAPSRRQISGYALPLIFVAIVVVFSVLNPDVFFTLSNFRSILATQAVLGILAIAVMLPLITGEFDLSVGANLGLGVVLATGLPSWFGFPAWPAIVATVLATSLVGLVNAILVVRFQINSFIATIGMSSVLSGAVLWFTGGTVIFEGIPEELTALGKGEIVPGPVVALLVIAAIAYYVLDYTPLGRSMYAIGGSRGASRLSGLPVDKITMGSFVGAGFLAGCAGVMQAAVLGTGDPTVGPSFLLPAFAAAFLGATAIRPGNYNVAGTVIAVYTLAVGVVGLTQLGVAFFVQPVFEGLALIVAVGVTSWLKSRRGAHV